MTTKTVKTEKQLKAMNVDQLASYFNGLVQPAAKVQTFKTKAIGVKTCLAALSAVASGKGAKLANNAPKKKAAAKPKLNAKVEANRKAAAKKAPAKKAKAAPATKKDDGLPRASTVYVQVKGRKTFDQYGSVAAAFGELDLPMGIHQSFRKELKENGTNVIDKFTFVTRNKHLKIK